MVLYFYVYVLSNVSCRILDFNVESEEDEEEVIRRRREQRQAIVSKYNGNSNPVTDTKLVPPGSSVLGAIGIQQTCLDWLICWIVKGFVCLFACRFCGSYTFG